MVELSDFVKDCNSLQEVMQKAKRNNRTLRPTTELYHAMNLFGFKVLSAKTDYALIEFKKSSPHWADTQQVIHPYGSTLAYVFINFECG